jgi:hypothetical protein
VPAVQTAFDTGLVLPPSNGQLVGGAVRSLNTPGSLSPFSIDFTNENPYAHVLGEDANKLDGLSQLTLTTWLNVSQYTSGNHRLMSKQAGGAFGGFSWNMNATPNDGPVGPDNFRLGLFVGNNVSSGATDFGSGFSTADVDAHNKWVFLAVTYDGTQAAGNTKFYIGGVGGPVTQLGADRTIVPLTVDSGTARFGVGFTDAAPTANTSVIGLQDDVRVYDGILSLAELDAVRRSIVIPEPGTLVLAIGGTLISLGRRRRRSV